MVVFRFVNVCLCVYDCHMCAFSHESALCSEIIYTIRKHLIGNFFLSFYIIIAIYRCMHSKIVLFYLFKSAYDEILSDFSP